MSLPLGWVRRAREIARRRLVRDRALAMLRGDYEEAHHLAARLYGSAGAERMQRDADRARKVLDRRRYERLEGLLAVGWEVGTPTTDEQVGAAAEWLREHRGEDFERLMTDDITGIEPDPYAAAKRVRAEAPPHHDDPVPPPAPNGPWPSVVTSVWVDADGRLRSGPLLDGSRPRGRAATFRAHGRPPRRVCAVALEASA